jgi:hypothetical protein
MRPNLLFHRQNLGSALADVAIASSSVSLADVTCARRTPTGSGATGVFQTIIAFKVTLPPI